MFAFTNPFTLMWFRKIREEIIEAYKVIFQQVKEETNNNVAVPDDDLELRYKFGQHYSLSKCYEYLEEYEDKISRLNKDLSSGMKYSSWLEKMHIDIEIIGVRGEYLEGVVIGKKFPWYNLQVSDHLNLL